MTEQIIYLVLNIYDGEDPTPVQLYDNLAAAEQHAAHLNKHLGRDEDEPVFEVWEADVLSEFNPYTGAVMPKQQLEEIIGAAVLGALVFALVTAPNWVPPSPF